MHEKVEIFLIDEEGIFLRSYTAEKWYFYHGEPEDQESPLINALRHYYMENAPKSILCKGYETPVGSLFWESELATPYGEEGIVEVGERLFLTDESGERFMDESIYEMLSRGAVPEDWYEISHD